MNERPKNLSPFQVERGDNRQLLHGQLLGALLVRIAFVAPGFHRWNSVYKGLNTKYSCSSWTWCGHPELPTWSWTLSPDVQPEWTCSGRSPRRWWSRQQLLAGQEKCPKRDRLLSKHPYTPTCETYWGEYGNILKDLTDNIWLEFARKYCVNNTSAGGRDDAWWINPSV